MQLQFWKYHISLGKKDYSILIPKDEIHDLFVVGFGPKTAIIFGNEKSLGMLSHLTSFLASNKDHIIFVHLKHNALTEYLRERSIVQDHSKDLVLLYHSQQLRIHEWKQIRGLIHKSGAHREEFHTTVHRTVTKRDRGQFWYREHKDFLDAAEQFETLFLVGSSVVFREISEDALELSLRGKEVYQSYPGSHPHEHIDDYARRVYAKNNKYEGWSLSLDFYDREIWA